MDIGEKIKQLRMKNGLTQQELANRTELTKGFISQLERDLTSPSIATLIDILECLGTDLRDFFNESVEEKVVFSNDDMFIKNEEEAGYFIKWLVPNAQKNSMEPILISLDKGSATETHDPHEGEEFGYILSGAVYVHIGNRTYKAKKGESFYFRPTQPHCLTNAGKSTATLLWICTPPSF